MKKTVAVIGLLLFAAAAALARPTYDETRVQPFPKTLINARYVYVASYDGDQFNASVSPDDRAAIGNVQAALRQWGRYMIVNHPQEADMILLVQSRPSEDVVAVYDAHVPGAIYLWRAMGRDGLKNDQAPLVQQLRQAVEAADNK
ncbi:MAG: hypothetical protein LAO09_16075 [Acidobacteriia bacterium]|nr:hypothetical protein [Terriglobia bacterium]